MNDGPITPDPPRLAREDEQAARLLERAEPRYRVGLDEGRAWQRVERTRRRRALVSWGASACAIAVVAIAFAGKLLESRNEPEVYALGPEPLPVAPVRPVEPAEDAPAVIDRTPQENPPVLPRPVAREPAASAEPAPTEARCKQWLFEGKPERAVDCFRTLSRKSGLDAEVALYEAARLSADLLSDGPGALELLDEHKNRFPNSALRGEVDWLRVRSLHRAGRLDEALSTSEGLLATPAGRALSAELHALRGRMFQDEKFDCERAIREFVALVGEPGPRGDDAEFRRARCLETLGRSADAEKAYEQYLARANAQNPEEAQKRLSILRE